MMNKVKSLQKYFVSFFLIPLTILFFCSCKKEYVWLREGVFKSTEIAYIKETEEKWESMEVSVSFFNENEQPKDINNAISKWREDGIYEEYEFYVTTNSLRKKIYFSYRAQKNGIIWFYQENGSYSLEMALRSNERDSASHLRVTEFDTKIVKDQKVVGKTVLYLVS